MGKCSYGEKGRQIHGTKWRAQKLSACENFANNIHCSLKLIDFIAIDRNNTNPTQDTCKRIGQCLHG